MMQALVSRLELLLFKWAGQWFPENRHAELEKLIYSSSSQYGFNDDAEGFIRFLEDSPSERVKTEMIQKILVGETYFFRDTPLWESLKNQILPKVISKHFVDRTIKIWDVGCSTGEEPYSVSLMLHSLIPCIEAWNIQILATDISEVSLAKAREGVYGKRALRELCKGDWDKWVEQDDREARVKPCVKNLVTFQYHNLSELNFPSLHYAGMDIIFCRNVLIYLDRDLVREVIYRFGQCLRKDGWLILAPTEVPLDPPKSLRIEQMRSGLMVMRPQDPATAKTDYVPSDEGMPCDSNISKFTRTGSAPLPLSSCFSSPSTPLVVGTLEPFSSSLKAGQNEPKNLVTSSTEGKSKASSESAYQKPELPKEEQASSKAQEADLILQSARSKADKGQLKEALFDVVNCVESYPTCVGAWIVLALIQEEMNYLEDAVESLQKAIYLNPNVAVAYLQLARVMARQGEHNISLPLNNFKKLTDNLSINDILPDSCGVKMGEAKRLAEQLERNQLRMGAVKK